MTDEELAARLKRLAPSMLPRASLLEEAADRILDLSAKCALLGANLAQVEREAEKPAASAEPAAWLTHSRTGMLRSLLPTRVPDESLMPGDVQTPLYSAPQPDRVAELEDEVERLRGWLAMLIDLYEDGPACTTDPDGHGEGDFLGYAIRIDEQPFKEICDWLNARDAADDKEAQE